MATLQLINGPNLNLLGTREPEQYGQVGLAEVERRVADAAAGAGLSVRAFQSNAEAALIECIHDAAASGVAFAIINPGAYTHTSVALRDAFLGTGLRFIEVHISNVYAREGFRHTSYLSDIAAGVIAGLGVRGYELAVAAIAGMLAEEAAAS